MTDVIGTEQVAKATALLQRYKTGKAALDKRIVDNLSLIHISEPTRRS